MAKTYFIGKKLKKKEKSVGEYSLFKGLVSWSLFFLSKFSWSHFEQINSLQLSFKRDTTV